jgi:hypothetical protein
MSPKNLASQSSVLFQTLDAKRPKHLSPSTLSDDVALWIKCVLLRIPSGKRNKRRRRRACRFLVLAGNLTGQCGAAHCQVLPVEAIRFRLEALTSASIASMIACGRSGSASRISARSAESTVSPSSSTVVVAKSVLLTVLGGGSDSVFVASDRDKGIERSGLELSLVA